jgi:hypothetical protein
MKVELLFKLLNICIILTKYCFFLFHQRLSFLEAKKYGQTRHFPVFFFIFENENSLVCFFYSSNCLSFIYSPFTICFILAGALCLSSESFLSCVKIPVFVEWQMKQKIRVNSRQNPVQTGPRFCRTANKASPLFVPIGLVCLIFDRSHCFDVESFFLDCAVQKQ